MKTLIIYSATALLISFGAAAQTTTPVNPAVKEGMKDLREDKIDLAKDSRELKKEIKEGDKVSAREIVKDIRSDKREIHHAVTDLKSEGIKHPNSRANRQLAAAHKKRKG